MSDEFILIEGARQNNLRNLNLRLPLGELIVITGVSGSGKSSLAFDTIYAEGQRRYVETFSPYARQFLDRMDRPRVTRIEGIPPAIAIDQVNPVRTSRSTVGTMTELNDHLKLLFARAARLFCRGCGLEVKRDTPQTICDVLIEGALPRGSRPALITFQVTIPKNFSRDEVITLLARQGYSKLLGEHESVLEVIQDRVRLAEENRARIVEDLEAALKHGGDRVSVFPLDAQGEALNPWRFSRDLHCAHCDIQYRDPVPNLFSFNSPIGACETCRGFGRTIGIDYGLVVPDEAKTLAQGAIKPWQSASYRECQDDLERFARRRRIPLDLPWRELNEAQQRWVLEGEGEWEDGVWYGVKRFFDWLETKSYKMHIRVLLSKYRAYALCSACQGARLKPDALLWRLGAGVTIHDVMLLPIERCSAFFNELQLPAPLDEAAHLLLREIRARLDYLVEVGLGYLTLDRQSRTLSGGEVQRINLTTALGTSLVNTLFVLDEPSIGLHARDIGRVFRVLQSLRDAGNSLIVVEHDPQVMLAADRILDLGPGPGERGGEVVFFGTPRELLSNPRSITAQYLRGDKTVTTSSLSPPFQRRVTSEPVEGAVQGKGDAWLEILGASEHNLKDIDISIPLNRLVCITGVSGSGKSTLIEQTLYRAISKLKGKPAEAPGRHHAIRGHEHIDDVLLIDQSRIGKTARSNPASYVGALDPIRSLFAAEPLARERGYSAGTFSFNSGLGRCPSCLGSGFEHVEMQFLSDVYLRCPDCDGRRYRPEVLEVKLTAPHKSETKSIAEVLDMSVSEAVKFFVNHADVLNALAPLATVGLGYLKLGQPVPTLSGGEAQRLKLAGHLAIGRGRRTNKTASLFLFDEPTTGLHFDDIAILLKAFRQLLAEGHSLVVIEHNLDVIGAADWLIDLGPEGGDAGGEVICAGTPEDVTKCAHSHTGAALRDSSVHTADVRCMAEVATPEGNSSGVIQNTDDSILIRNAREHNLKGIAIQIPRDRLTVISGVSGSGKSTLAFDILFAEGQRRYLESLNAYARQFVQPAARPDVDAIFGIPPTVAIEQRTSRGGRKSTVATMTELYHFLRLLFVKLGVQHCPDCGIAIEPQTREAILAKISRDYRGLKVRLLAPLVVARKGYYTDLAKWANAKGFTQLRVDGELKSTANWPRLARFIEHDIELPVGELIVNPKAETGLRALIDSALEFGKGAVKVAPTGASAAPEVAYSTRRACPVCGRSFAEPDPRLFSFNSKHGWCSRCYGTGLSLPGFDAEQTGEEIWWNDWWDAEERPCPSCQGRRLKPEALAVRLHGRSIAELTEMPVEAAGKFFRTLRLAGREAEIARDILAELRSRLQFLKEVGLAYLTLDRASPTLSGGEAQRLRLASQLGSNLRGVCYILDEPTIGLHVRDNRLLIKTLKKLKAKGNTVVVVEHDEDTIRQAEYVIDLGPGGGMNGGQVIAHGTVEELLLNPESVTGRLLARPLRHPLDSARRTVHDVDNTIKIFDASLHNLKRVTLRIPLERLTCVTGVSGSGKSTLVRHVLHDNLLRLLARKPAPRAGVQGCEEIRGFERVQRVLEVDQTPIGKTPRSCPATYVGFWDYIRRLFAQTPEARMRGYAPARFSFNVAGGRCEACQGQGYKTIVMSFLPDVKVACDVCAGKRFNAETLAVRFKDKSIAEVLAMSVAEAAKFFAAHAPVHHALRLAEEVGLGYLTLGQQSPTLSGGEAQRIKLVTELAKTASPVTIPSLASGERGISLRSAASNSGKHTLYVLDEPTIGLHMADVEKLIRVLHRLVAAGNTAVIVEHNLDVIAEADWVIDLGPEGGDEGGHVVAEGAPEAVARVKRGSHTAKILAGFLKQRRATKEREFYVR
jgi:excinuclease ABC subunit A